MSTTPDDGHFEEAKCHLVVALGARMSTTPDDGLFEETEWLFLVEI